MPLIHPSYFHTVFYLYPNKAAAKKGDAVGGTGFFVSVSTDNADQFGPYFYAVTNRHVISSDNCTLRVNTNDDVFDILDSEPHEWEPHPDHDLCILDISLSRIHKFVHIPENQFLTKEIMEKHFIGPGDGVFMVGRFITVEGQQKNTPSARFGNVSMVPAEKIPHPENLSGYQESFAVEMRSISGYSGSPVFFYNDTLVGRPSQLPLGPKPLWLIGIEWGRIPHREPVRLRSGKPHPEGLYISHDSAMSGVVPVWRLQELLYSERVVKQREANMRRVAEQRANQPLPPELNSAMLDEPGSSARRKPRLPPKLSNRLICRSY